MQPFFTEYVDSEGELQYVDDPVLLRSAAGSLGLLGIVTAITYKVSNNYAYIRILYIVLINCHFRLGEFNTYTYILG